MTRTFTRTILTAAMIVAVFCAISTASFAAEKKDQQIKGIKDSYTINAYQELKLYPYAEYSEVKIDNTSVSNKQKIYCAHSVKGAEDFIIVGRRAGTFSVTFAAKETEKYKRAEKKVRIIVKNGWNKKKSGLSVDTNGPHSLYVEFKLNPNATKYRVWYKKKGEKKYKHKDISQSKAEKFWKGGLPSDMPMASAYRAGYTNLTDLKKGKTYYVKLQVFTKDGKKTYARNAKGKTLIKKGKPKKVEWSGGF